MRKLLALLVLAVCTVPQVWPQSRPQFERHLPSGAVLANGEKPVIVADLDDDGQDEAVVLFVSKREHTAIVPGVMVFGKEGDAYEPRWSTSLPHTTGFDPLSGVHRLVPNGPPQIVVYWTVGASCQGTLDIFQYRDGQIESIAGDWKTKTGCQNAVKFEDLDGDGVREVILKASRNTVVPHIYRWSDEGYILDRERFPDYYEDGLAQITSAATSAGKYPASARLNWGWEATEIFLLQKRYAQAIEFCRRLMAVLEDPQRIMPSSRDVKPGSSRFESEMSRAKAKLYHRMSEISARAGRLQQAAEFERQAIEVDSGLTN